jgi:hypothetical protein
MICMVELDAIAIDEADGCVRTEGRDGELFQEISPNLEICLLLTIGFLSLRFSESPFCNPSTGATRC